MDVQLTSQQKEFVRRAIESGRVRSEQDAVEQALALWAECERQRTEFFLSLEESKASLACGEAREITEHSMRQLPMKSRSAAAPVSSPNSQLRADGAQPGATRGTRSRRDFWYYIAKESSSTDLANQLNDNITGRFVWLAGFRHLGRSRGERHHD
jgi:Arc/MetJ-type ribon-helix-helix transcriptional regulator